MKRKFVLAALVLTLAIAISCSSGSSGNAPSAAGAPAGLTAAPGNGQVTLAWKAVTGVAAYNIYYSTASGVTPSNGNKISAGSASSYTQTGLVNGTTYYYVVTAVTSTGESSPSPQVSAKPVPALLAAPTGFTAAAGSGQVALSWNPVAGATSYNVYYGTSSGVTPANGTKIAGLTGNSYTQTGLSNNTTYYFIVTAVNMAGESSASAAVSATPFVSAPAAPTGLTATPGNGQVLLSWNSSPSATSYNVYCLIASTSADTKTGGIIGTSYTATNLTDGALYYFTVTAQNTAGESPASNQVSTTPTAGTTIAITPGQTSTGTLQANQNVSLSFTFPATAVTQNAVATISSVLQSEIPVPLSVQNSGNSQRTQQSGSNDSFIAAFQIGLTPASITTLNVAARLSGNLSGAVASGSTLNLAALQNSAWTDIATLVVGANGSLAENLSSRSLPGLLTPGTYALYQPAAGSSTTVSNFGVALLADDGYDMSNGSAGLQIFHLYGGNGNLLSAPLASYLDYPNSSALDSVALSPDGSAGIVLDDHGNVNFFSSFQTGSPAKTTSLSLSAYGSPDAVAMLPNGDEAVVSVGSSNLVLISGILSGSPVAATLIDTPATRSGLVLSNDGSILLARGSTGLTVFSATPLANPQPGSIAGTVSHSFTQRSDLSLGWNEELQSGREGMAISPADSSRAVVVNPSGSVQILTGLPASATAGPVVTLPGGFVPHAVSISLDGALAIIGGSGGLLLYNGVNTGELALVGEPYAPSLDAGPYSLSANTLGITLDGKYVVVGDQRNKVLAVIPFSSSGFGAVVSTLSEIAVPDGDQLLIH